MYNDPLIHWGIPGMKWGVRRNLRGYANQVKAKLGVGTLKPTFEYRDSKGRLVTRYGPGKYGGGPKPTSKGDNKFYKEANKQASKMDFKKTDALLKKEKNTKYKDLVNARNERSNKILLGLGVTLVASLGTLKYISLLSNKLPGLDTATDFSEFNSAYENWLATG